jgi:hypothetical protein
MRYKDANACLMAGVSAAEMAECIREPEIIRPEQLKDIYDFELAIWEKFHPEGRDQLGLLLPWGNSNGSSLPFRFRYGEVSLWTGYTKHGKSEVLNHCIIDLCWQGERAMICSLEIAAAETYRKLIRMSQGKRRVCEKDEREQFRDRCLTPLSRRVWVYDKVGNAAIEDVLNVMLYGYQRFGIRQFVLDSLMRFSGLGGDGQDKWELQKLFMERLVEFAQRYSVHIHLVAHSRKPDGRKTEAAMPRRYEVAGSADLVNEAFNVIVVWRNKPKQQQMETIFQEAGKVWAQRYPKDPEPEWKVVLGGRPKFGGEPLAQRYERMMDVLGTGLTDDMSEEFAKLVAEHDAYFAIDAQRGGDGDCPERRLWFHYDSLQFLEVGPLESKDARRFPTEYARRPVAEMDEEI